MLSYNEIKPKMFIVFNEGPHEVLASHIFRKQQRKPVNQTKLKNLRTGKVLEHSFHQSDTIEEAELSVKRAVYLFKKPDRHGAGLEYWFCEEGDPRERFSLGESGLGINPLLLKEKTTVEILTFEAEVLRVTLPIKETYAVVDAPPAVKGNTAQGGSKQVALETGAVISVPMFIREGDAVVVNTETGEYVSRA